MFLADKNVPFLDNIPPTLYLEFLRAADSYIAQLNRENKTGRM